VVRRVCWLQLVAAVGAILLTGSRGALTWEYRKPTWLLFGLLAAHAYSRRRACSAQPISAITPAPFWRLDAVTGAPERL
jgi:hypothetical protein